MCEEQKRPSLEYGNSEPLTIDKESYGSASKRKEGTSHTMVRVRDRG